MVRMRWTDERYPVPTIIPRRRSWHRIQRVMKLIWAAFAWLGKTLAFLPALGWRAMKFVFGRIGPGRVNRIVSRVARKASGYTAKVMMMPMDLVKWLAGTAAMVLAVSWIVFLIAFDLFGSAMGDMFWSVSGFPQAPQVSTQGPQEPPSPTTGCTTMPDGLVVCERL